MKAYLLFACALALAPMGCKKKTTAPTTEPTQAPAPPAPAGGGNTNYVPGGGAVQNVRQAARRTVALNDLHQIGIAITQWELENNRMPSASEITNSVLRSYPNLKKLVDEGTVILTGTTNRSGLWAYEVEADTKGGLGLVAGTASRYDAATIKSYLGR
jgi:hypothetical protein